MTVVGTICVVLLSITGVLCIVRIVRGPTMLDRTVAAAVIIEIGRASCRERVSRYV